MPDTTPAPLAFYLAPIQIAIFRLRDIDLDSTGFGFDYFNQAWIKDMRYVRCGHRGESCDCFGRVHAGEIVR